MPEPEVSKGRKRELRSYLNGLDALEDYTSGQITRLPPQVLSNDFMRILKASTFLLVYNYVEGCVLDAFLRIYKSIQSDNLKYQDLRTELRTIWIDFKAKPLHQNPTSSHKSYRDLASSLVEAIVEENLIWMDRNAVGISGNLNEKKIRSICENHGIKLPAKAHRITDEIEVIMNTRNELAHGNLSFGECGRDYVVTDLRRVTDSAIDYIDLFLQGVDTYIGSKNYKRA